MSEVILFSGHFINRKELQKEIGICGCSDENILAAGFDKKGSAFFEKLNGLQYSILRFVGAGRDEAVNKGISSGERLI